MTLACNYIRSCWQSPNGGEEVAIRNPANAREIVFKTVYADVDLARQAINSASAAWPLWKRTALAERVRLVEEFLTSLERDRDKIAEIITLENGKLFPEAKAEISASLGEGRYQLKFLAENLAEFINGQEIRYEPLGATLLITPWNFPVATILRKLIPAILTGNTALVKASEFTPYTSMRLFLLLAEAGFPDGVVNLVVGPGDELVPAILKSNLVSAVSFTGSVKNGQEIARQIDPVATKYQAELGGNNTLIVLRDADISQAAQAAVSNGFACCGQWCTGTGRIIVEKSVYDRFIELLPEKVLKIKLGEGFDEEATMGPLINQTQLQRVQEAVSQAVAEGGSVLTGGNKAPQPELSAGCFFQPTILTNITPRMSIADQEIFGPVLVVLKVADADEALEILNNSNYGLSFSVYTRNEKLAEKFISEANCGLCHVNLPTAYRDVALPLLGWQDSGIGMPESGRFMRDFFTRTKAIYRGN